MVNVVDVTRLSLCGGGDTMPDIAHTAPIHVGTYKQTADVAAISRSILRRTEPLRSHYTFVWYRVLPRADYDVQWPRCSNPQDLSRGEMCMTWKTPKIREIALGAEINCYACAEITA
jgi:coenzyme PQQ precursor peptide PqqA